MEYPVDFPGVIPPHKIRPCCTYIKTDVYICIYIYTCKQLDMYVSLFPATCHEEIRGRPPPEKVGKQVLYKKLGPGAFQFRLGPTFSTLLGNEIQKK